MKDLKNPELKRELLICAAAGLVLAGLGLLISPLCALLVLGAGLVFTGLHVWFVRRRYREIAALSRSLDRILHGQDQLLEDNAEGELAILRSEIAKMTLRLKESSDRLSDEKQELTRALADISHQLRTPLTSINLTLSLLAGEEDEGRRLRLTRELKRSLERIDWLVETLLKLSKLDAGVVRFEPASLRAAALAETALRPLRIRRTKEAEGLLPEKQAAAAAGSRYKGAEARLVLQPQGVDRFTPAWVVAVDGRILWTQGD